MSKSTTNRPRVIVGVDGSAGSKPALEWAARIATSENAAIDVVGVWEYPVNLGWTALPAEYSPKQDMEKAIIQVVDDVFGAERPAGLRVLTHEGNAAGVLIEKSADALMVIVGSRGHGGFVGLLIGSVSARVAEHAKCPVLVVHTPKPHTPKPHTPKPDAAELHAVTPHSEESPS
jgi:nucleotide-binding universal stress UspA family protein